VTRSTALGGVVRGSAAILVASCIQYTEIPQAPERPAVSAPPPASVLTHRVEPGETVWRIARRHGLPVEVLIETNHIEDVKKLRVGQLLTIPVAPQRSSERGLAFREPADRRAVSPSGSAVDAGWKSIDEALALGEDHLRAAELDQSLEMANQALRLLAEAPAAPATRTRVARAEVIAATVHIAYAREEAALECLRRALRADPHLQLDPAATSPKLLRIFEEARSDLD
jgi:LysM repeat protein